MKLPARFCHAFIAASIISCERGKNFDIDSGREFSGRLNSDLGNVTWTSRTPLSARLGISKIFYWISHQADETGADDNESESEFRLKFLSPEAFSQVLADTHHESSDIELNLVCTEIRRLKENDAKRPQLESVKAFKLRRDSLQGKSELFVDVTHFAELTSPDSPLITSQSSCTSEGEAKPAQNRRLKNFVERQLQRRENPILSLRRRSGRAYLTSTDFSLDFLAPRQR